MINYRRNKRNKTIIKIGFSFYIVFMVLILVFSESGYIKLKKIQNTNNKLEHEINSTI